MRTLNSIQLHAWDLIALLNHVLRGEKNIDYTKMILLRCFQSFNFNDKKTAQWVSKAFWEIFLANDRMLFTWVFYTRHFDRFQFSTTRYATVAAAVLSFFADGQK